MKRAVATGQIGGEQNHFIAVSAGYAEIPCAGNFPKLECGRLSLWFTSVDVGRRERVGAPGRQSGEPVDDV